jgi:hypothetical protein
MAARAASDGSHCRCYFLNVFRPHLKYLKIENCQAYLREAVSYYQPLLERYARCILRDEIMAANIVKEVLEIQYSLNSLVPSKHLRQVLKTDVLNYCYYHIQAKIFDQPVIKASPPPHLETIIQDYDKDPL